MSKFQKTTPISLPFNILTAAQKKYARNQGQITNLVNPDKKQVKVEAQYLTRLQRAKYLNKDQHNIADAWPSIIPGQQTAKADTNAPRNPRGKRRHGRDVQPSQTRNTTGDIIRTDLNCGVGTLSVVQGAIATVMAFIGRMTDKSAIILHGLSSGLKNPLATVIFLDGKFQNFTKAAGEIPVDTLKQAIQYGCHLNGVQLSVGWVPLYGVLDQGGIKVMVVQSKALNTFQNQTDKDALKGYIKAFDRAVFTKDGNVRGQKDNHAILSAIPLTNGVRTTYAWGNNEFAAIPMPQGVTGDLRHSMVGDDKLLVAKAGADTFNGITADSIYHYLNRVDMKPAWTASDKFDGALDDISLGIYNEDQAAFSVIVSLQPNGKGNRFIPVSVTDKGADINFKVDTKHAIPNGDDVAEVPALVRIMHDYATGVNHGNKDSAVSFIPEGNLPAPLIALFSHLMPTMVIEA